MNRARSLRPRKLASVHELERLVRQLGPPPKDALAAVLETLAPSDARPPFSEEAIAEFLDQAVEICMSAHRAWEQCGNQARAHLRGFSLDLLTMICQEVLGLERHFRDYKQCEIEVREAAERATQLRGRNLVLFEQARAVLQMVGGASALAQCTADPQERVAAALNELADIGRKILQDTTPVVKSRCQLYHLDTGYVHALIAASNELGGAEQTASDESSIAAKRAQVERALDLVCPLLEYMSQVFELARRFEPSIPRVAKLEPPKAASSAKLLAAQAKPAAGRGSTDQIKIASKPSETRRVQPLAIPREANSRPKR